MKFLKKLWNWLFNPIIVIKKTKDIVKTTTPRKSGTSTQITKSGASTEIKGSGTSTQITKSGASTKIKGSGTTTKLE